MQCGVTDVGCHRHLDSPCSALWAEAPGPAAAAVNARASAGTRAAVPCSFSPSSSTTAQTWSPPLLKTAQRNTSACSRATSNAANPRTLQPQHRCLLPSSCTSSSCASIPMLEMNKFNSTDVPSCGLMSKAGLGKLCHSPRGPGVPPLLSCGAWKLLQAADGCHLLGNSKY